MHDLKFEAGRRGRTGKEGPGQKSKSQRSWDKLQQKKETIKKREASGVLGGCVW